MQTCSSSFNGSHLQHLAIEARSAMRSSVSVHKQFAMIVCYLMYKSRSHNIVNPLIQQYWNANKICFTYVNPLSDRTFIA
uniref:Uncharacterized protein n=1 Tax=Arundo donax TaxID=35708 RepID=A0A0A9GM68_ARUDO